MNEDLINERAKPWISLLDSLQTLGIEEELPIPQIVVFGDQSSGKSSLLESISGIPFPKGVGLVTRCPTRISMSKCSANEPWAADIKLSPTVPGSEAFNLKGKIESMQELSVRLAEAASIVTPKSSSEFSSEIIQVTVQSPSTPNLSLIDLPGIIRTTTFGQEKSVIANVNDLLDSFMRQPETVILAVIPANQDIATIDVLERAYEYDPNGSRTIGVLTKPDLIDRGAEDEVLKIVMNVRKPLKLGYVIVKNRSQADLKSDMSLLESQHKEDLYFTSHEVWSKIPANSRGIKPLCERLTSIIVSRAMDRGPFLKWYLVDKLTKIEKRIPELGTEMPEDEQGKKKLLIKIISRYTSTLRQIAVGDYRDQLAQSNTELRIRYHVTEILDALKKTLAMNVPDLTDEEYSARLQAGISEMRGRELPGFGHTRLLLSTVADELETWQLQVDECISEVFTAYTSTASALATKTASQLPALYDEIVACLHLTCDIQAIEVGRRIDEMFIRCTECASTDKDLIDSINLIRLSRFEAALQEILANPVTTTTISAETSNNYTTTTANQQQSSSSSSTSKISTKAGLQAYLKEVLGGFYMHYHSIGFGAHLQLEDAQAALKAYWRICEKRLNEDVESAVDMLLLQRCSEIIESTLLSNVQEWVSDPNKLSSIVSEDVQVKEEREALIVQRTNVKNVLEKLEDIIPGCVAKSPFTL